MKKLLTITFLFIGSLAWAQKDSLATVYFLYDVSGFGSAIFARIDAKPCVKIDGKHYSVHERPAGEHTVSATLKDYKFEGILLKTKWEAGKTYYYSILTRGGYHLEEVTEEKAKEIMRDLTEERTYIDKPKRKD